MKTIEHPGEGVQKKRGRPLSFDRQQAVQRAMVLFWEHGYEATSLNDLTAALGVTPSSIYTAFGDKKGLFLAAVGHYMSGPITARSIVEEAATAQAAAHGLLHAAAIGFTGHSTPRGCLLASSAISCSAMAQDVRETLADLRKGIEGRLREKIKHDVKIGQLPPNTDAMALAAHTMAVIQGMSTLARDGASRATLLRVVHTAVQCWPAGDGVSDGPSRPVPERPRRGRAAQRAG
ncbi:MAG: TetR/AcrR family transcriptional regulator [Cytophagales bacterium]|nr:TetR/AcrR family transcriptional regulator [Rhizobacter sp.]